MRSFRKFLPMSALAFATVLNASCTDSGEPGTQDCGSAHDVTFARSGTAMFTGSGFAEGSVTSGHRNYFWSQSFQNVCTKAESQTQADFTVNFVSSMVGHNAVAVGQASADPLLQPYSVSLAAASPVTTGFGVVGTLSDIGLQQAWGDGPGEMTVQLWITYPATSDAAADRAKFMAEVSDISFKVHYYDYVAPTTN